MNRILYLFLITMLSASCNPKIVQPKTENNLNNQFSNLEIDILGNKYLYSEIEVIKITPKQDTIRGFSTQRTSNFDHVSVSNPNKIVVFSRDSQVIWILDSTLSIIEEIDLYKMDLGAIGFATRLLDNRLLYYSQPQKKFYKLNDRNQLIYETDVLWDFSSDVIDIIQSEDQYLVLMSNGESHLFDDYGNYIKPLLKQTENELKYFYQGYLYIIKGEDLEYIAIDDPIIEPSTYRFKQTSEIDDFSIHQNTLYILSKGKIIEEKLVFLK